MSEAESSNELPAEVVQQIEDLVRTFYGELSETAKQEGNIYRPTLEAKSTSNSFTGVCLVRAENSGELTIAVNPSEVLKLDLTTIAKTLTVWITFLTAIQKLLASFPNAKAFLIQTIARYLNIPID